MTESVDPRPLRRVLRGVYALALTPFNEDGSIDWEALPPLLDWYLDKGFNGIFFPCGSSEYKQLEVEEIIALARRAVRHVAGRAPVVSACTPADSLEENIAIANRMWDEARPDCCVATLPPFLPADDGVMMDYHERLHEAVKAPLMVYEIPGGAGYKFSPAAVARLAEMPRYYGYKDTCCDLPVCIEKIKAARGRLTVFQARSEDVWPSLQAGAEGMMCTASNAVPKLFVKLWECSRSGQVEKGERIHEWICEHVNETTRGYNLSSKVLMAEEGLPLKIASRSRPSPPEEDVMAGVRRAVADAGRLLEDMG